MKIYEWYEYLPKEIRDKAQAYFFESEEVRFFNTKVKSLSHAIICGIYWDGTKEGGQYWANICRKYMTFKP